MPDVSPQTSLTSFLRKTGTDFFIPKVVESLIHSIALQQHMMGHY